MLLIQSKFKLILKWCIHLFRSLCFVFAVFTKRFLNHWPTDIFFVFIVAKPAVEEVKELEAPKFSVEIQTLEATTHQSGKFTCKATGKPTPEILWYKNDKEISKTDNRFTIQYGEEGESSLLIVDVLPEHDGTYAAMATNEAGTAKCKAELFVEGESL